MRPHVPTCSEAQSLELGWTQEGPMLHLYGQLTHAFLWPDDAWTGAGLGPFYSVIETADALQVVPIVAVIVGLAEGLAFQRRWDASLHGDLVPIEVLQANLLTVWGWKVIHVHKFFWKKSKSTLGPSSDKEISHLWSGQSSWPATSWQSQMGQPRPQMFDKKMSFMCHKRNILSLKQ